MERTLSQHPREPEWSCEMIDRIMNKACELKDEVLMRDTDKVRSINKELRVWGRREAKEVDRLKAVVKMLEGELRGAQERSGPRRGGEMFNRMLKLD